MDTDPQDEPGELVTVTTFADPLEARMACNRLEEAGIAAFLSDEGLVSMVWILSNALRDVKLQVAKADAQRAAEILAETAAEAAAAREREPELPWREATARRSLRAAVFGLLMCPLQLYAVWLVLAVFLSDEPLSPRGRRHAQAAALICFPYLLAFLLLLRSVLPF